MKRVFPSAILFFFLLVACGQSTPVPPSTPTTAPPLACSNGVCIRQIHPEVSEDALLINFEMVNKDGEVKFGEDLAMAGDQLMALYLVKNGEEDEYIFGANVPKDLIECYTGNDIPWSDGHLAAVCGISIPLNILQVRPQNGERLKVELPNYEFVQEFIYPDEG